MIDLSLDERQQALSHLFGWHLLPEELQDCGGDIHMADAFSDALGTDPRAPHNQRHVDHLFVERLAVKPRAVFAEMPRRGLPSK